MKNILSIITLSMIVCSAQAAQKVKQNAHRNAQEIKYKNAETAIINTLKQENPNLNIIQEAVIAAVAYGASFARPLQNKPLYTLNTQEFTVHENIKEALHQQGKTWASSSNSTIQKVGERLSKTSKFKLEDILLVYPAQKSRDIYTLRLMVSTDDSLTGPEELYNILKQKTGDGLTLTEKEVIKAARLVGGYQQGKLNESYKDVDLGQGRAELSLRPSQDDLLYINKPCSTVALFGGQGSYHSDFTRALAQAACTGFLCEKKHPKAFMKAYNTSLEAAFFPGNAQQCKPFMSSAREEITDRRTTVSSENVEQRQEIARKYKKQS